MAYQTETKKCMFNGWKSETIIKLEDCLNSYGKPAVRVLEFTTLKRNSGISTHASVTIVQDNGNKEFVMFQDYSKSVMQFPGKRASEKSIKECHNIASEKFEEHLIAAKIQYKI